MSNSKSKYKPKSRSKSKLKPKSMQPAQSMQPLIPNQLTELSQFVITFPMLQIAVRYIQQKYSKEAASYLNSILIHWKFCEISAMSKEKFKIEYGTFGIKMFEDTFE